MLRRALPIDEAAYGPDHPDVAIKLTNLAQLLKATNRLSEAEPLMRRCVETACSPQRAPGTRHLHLRRVIEI